MFDRAAEHVHRRGDRLVRFGAQRSQRHCARDESPIQVLRGFHLNQWERPRCRAHFQQIAQHRRLFFFRLGGERAPRLRGIRRRCSRRLGRAGNGLQQAHGLRLPSMRLGLIRLAEANPAVIGQIFCRRDGHQRSAAVSCLGSISARVAALRAQPHLAQARFQFRESNPTQRRRRAFEAALYHLAAQPEAVEKMRAAVAVHHRDAHLRHDLREAQIEGVQKIRFALLRIELPRRFQRKPRADRARAHPQQHRSMMQIAAIRRFHRKPDANALAHADQRMMHGARRQRHGNRNAPAHRIHDR